jgi:hypothetical protein
MLESEAMQKNPTISIDVNVISDRFDGEMDRYLITVWANTRKALQLHIFCYLIEW